MLTNLDDGSMRVVAGPMDERSIEELKRINSDMHRSKQEAANYRELFRVGNPVGVYVSGCPALILAVIETKVFTWEVWKELCLLLVNDIESTGTPPFEPPAAADDDDVEPSNVLESALIKVTFINDQPGFCGKFILGHCISY
ncbi:hypothetical protein H310_06614 [Aphanomyces invadans]|uniref:Uncharacterized protein n=1 Tax=Aphanomyces invadans TaxID=157072 RepID=A0A024U433_9STRA|nr:hypothetical protein H310_06614 [Aphanomyces invadans]ETW00970.1 hypothetical protein H310_06614 [Aphanomyces invadans]|eukprot:XP_008869968.1 hypothetical protein H310_06614 [Aphanomyces invadans]